MQLTYYILIDATNKVIYGFNDFDSYCKMQRSFANEKCFYIGGLDAIRFDDVLNAFIDSPVYINYAYKERFI